MKIPALLVKIGQRIPLPLSSIPFALGLEMARHQNWLQPPTTLHGHSFALQITDIGLRVHFECTAHGFRPLLNGLPGVELSANLVDFIALMRGTDDADTLFFQRRLSIRGDTELGLMAKNWLDASERPAWLQKLSA
jgi:predicted lipid carrier protein YhbT